MGAEGGAVVVQAGDVIVVVVVSIPVVPTRIRPDLVGGGKRENKK